ncbi:MAG: hypothetical protein OXN89_11905 [Bryobacterales bacterium]|nr:hypothetical protein [Bryobacterales bacterium]
MSYQEDPCCSLADFGHSRDSKRQMASGLLCAPDGCPIPGEVFAGNTADPSPARQLVGQFCERYGIERAVLPGNSPCPA